MFNLEDWKFRNLKRDMARWERLHWPNIKLFLIIFLYLIILVGCLYLGLFVV